MTENEIEMLRAIARGHPNRKVTVITGGISKQISGLTREEIQIAVQGTDEEIGDPIARLVQKNLIAVGWEYPSIVGKLAGQKSKIYMFITTEGEATLAVLAGQKSAPHWLDHDDIGTVEAMLDDLGFDLTDYGVAAAILSLRSGYSDAETASHIALATIARDVRELGPDIRALMAIASQTSRMLNVLKGFKERGLMRENLLKNDVLALVKVVTPSPEQIEWIDKILSDQVVANDRVARRRNS